MLALVNYIYATDCMVADQGAGYTVADTRGLGATASWCSAERRVQYIQSRVTSAAVAHQRGPFTGGGVFPAAGCLAGTSFFDAEDRISKQSRLRWVVEVCAWCTNYCGLYMGTLVVDTM